jgi:hypothetical protein
MAKKQRVRVSSKYGSRQNDWSEGRQGGQQSAQGSQEQQGGKKRGRVGTLATTRAKKALVLVEWMDSFGCSASWQYTNG